MIPAGAPPVPLLVGLSWDTRVTRGAPMDVDGLAVVVDAAGRALSPGHVVLFRNPPSPDGGVRHVTDLAMTDGDDEKIFVTPSLLPAGADTVLIAAVLDAPQHPGASFAQVRRLLVRLVDGATGLELARYPVSGAQSEVCLVLGELYRHRAAWKFRAVGQGFASGLPGDGRQARLPGLTVGSPGHYPSAHGDRPAGDPAVLMLLDSASMYFRAFHGVPETMVGPHGRPVNAVRGFLDMVATLVSTRRPTRLVACLDLDWRPGFRVAAVPSYKAHRVAPEGGETVPEQDRN